jgi:hypothetical protein
MFLGHPDPNPLVRGTDLDLVLRNSDPFKSQIMIFMGFLVFYKKFCLHWLSQRGTNFTTRQVNAEELSQLTAQSALKF